MNKDQVGKRFKLLHKLGSGSFGEVYLGQETATGASVAIKLEKASVRSPQLVFEAKIYKSLQGGVGIPKLYHQGTESNFNIMVIDCLGLSLEDLFQKAGKQFSHITVLLLAQQMISRMEFMHKRSFIHRDIKPDNFMVGNPLNGLDAERMVYVIDFGLSRRYRHPRTKQHIKYREGKGLVGTPRYASINNHLGIEQSRRDDMEAIAYVLIYFCKEKLPWQGLKAKSKRVKYTKIMNKKMEVKEQDLCEGCPEVLEKYLLYCRSLRFEDKPNYPFLRQLFRDEVQTLANKQGLSKEQIEFDWVLKKMEENMSKGVMDKAAPPPNRMTRRKQPNSPSPSRRRKGKARATRSKNSKSKTKYSQV